MKSGPDKHRLLIENLPDAFAYHQIVTDEEGAPHDYIFLEINNAFEKMTGLERDEVIGKRVTTVLPEIEKSDFDWIGTFGQLALSGKPARFETNSEPLGRWYDVSAYSDEHGYFTAVFRDVTESKKTEQALQESEANYRDLVENINEVVYILDENANITYVSPIVEVISGYTPSELAKMRFTDFVYPDDLEGRMEQFFKIMSGVNEASEYRFITKDGRIVWVRTAAHPVVRGGRVVGVQGVLTDITERKQAEEKLKKKEEYLRGILESQRDLVVRINLENRFTYVNDAYCKTFGKTREELVGKSFTPLVHEEDIENTLQAMEKLYVLPYRVYMEQRAMTVHGWRWIAWEDSGILNDEGELVEIQGVGRDITTRKQAEEALRYHYEFEKMVSEIASYFINLPADQVDEGIKYALKECGEFFQVERSYLFLISPDGQSLSMTHEWHKKEVEPQINRLQGVPIGKRPWWYAQVIEKGYVYIHDVNDMPEEAEAERNEFLKQNITSLLSIPMIANGKVIGSLGLDAIKNKKAWAEKHITLLKILTKLITNALERHWSDEKIRSLSLYDQLTGLYNRHMLEEEMQRLNTGRQLPISIIIADLNGLKLINDTYGHGVGDEMLICAADVLKNSCRKEDIIARWGGDEFVILLPQTRENAAQIIKKRIKDRCRDAYVNDMPVSIALGLSVKENMDKDLLMILKEAEDDMYNQKLVESQSAKSAVLKTLLKALEEKSFETEEHARNMQEMASKIAEKIKLPGSEINRLGLLITLHDIGKIKIAEDILTKTESLTPGEWELMKKHPETGYRIALAAEEFAHVAGDILAHHEHWDGSGYPQGLKGEKIPLLARIVAIADTYEVMSRGRSYKKALTPEEIKAEFKKCAGTQFDPELVEIFLAIMDDGIEK